MISKNFPVQAFVPKEVFAIYGEKSSQFVSHQLVVVFDFIHDFFNQYFKNLDSNIEKVVIVVNNYYDQELIKLLGQVFNNRGLRTYQYIDGLVESGKAVATLSQHIGGSTNAGDFNVILYFKGGKRIVRAAGDIHDIIMKHQDQFLKAGVTTLEDKSMTPGWTHADCRFTGLYEILIVKP